VVTAERLTEFHEEQRAARVRPGPAPRSRFTRFLTLWGVLVATALFTVASYAQSSVANYRIDALNQAYQTALAQNQALSAQVAQLSNPHRLVADAPSLNMAPPSAVMVVTPTTPSVVLGSAHNRNSLAMVTSTLGLIIGSLGDAITGW